MFLKSTTEQARDKEKAHLRDLHSPPTVRGATETSVSTSHQGILILQKSEATAISCSPMAP